MLTHGISAAAWFPRSDWEKILAEARLVTCQQAIDRILQRRAHSVGEIVRKLRSRKFAAAEIDKSICWAKQVGLLEDFRFCCLFIEEKRRLAKWGVWRISSELKKRQVDSDTIEAAFAACDEEGAHNERDAARELAEQKWGQLSGRDEPFVKRRDRLYRYLANRGYSLEIVREAVGQVVPEYDVSDESRLDNG